jgi:CubicO group peptidase (beta-lactamase class C family)
LRRILAMILCASAVLFAADEYFPPPDSAGGWRTLKDAAAISKIGGMDLGKLDYAFEYASRTSQHGGLVVIRHGYLVYEKYYGRGNREATPAMASVGKAYASIACGIMLHDKHDQIPDGLETLVFNQKYLPEALPLEDPRKANIKLGQLLSMAAGLHGEGSNPGFVDFVPSVKLEPVPRPSEPLDQDMAALRTPLWCNPGEGYSYASNSPHIASVVLRHLVGMEMQQYIDEKLAKPMGWGHWGYALKRGDTTLPHTPGGGDTAIRSTDVARFGYLILHKGRWGSGQLVPAEYIEMAGKPNPYQKHAPFSLMFEVNADGHVAGAPRDAFFKSGGGGYGIVIIPSLDLVIYKMAGDDRQPAGLPLRRFAGQLEASGQEPVQRRQYRNGRRPAPGDRDGGGRGPVTTCC